MKVKILLISVGAFVIAFGIGFGTTLFIRGQFQSQSESIISPVLSTETKNSVKVASSPVQEETVESNPVQIEPIQRKSEVVAPIITSVDGPEFSVKDRYYIVTVHAAASNASTVEYILENENGIIISSGESAQIKVPQSQSGIYYVSAMDTKTGAKGDSKEIKGCIIRKMSKSRLEQICNSGDYTMMRNAEAYELSPSIKLSFIGIPEDQEAASIDDICTRISLGIWSSVSIVEILYDDLNLVQSVKFQVNL